MLFRSVATPVLLLTAKGEVSDRIKGLNAGADDYLSKPFARGEFVARVRALTRRSGAFTPDQLADLAKPFFGRATVCDSLADALELAWEDGFEGCVICGSLYLASEARAMLVPAKN